MNGRGPQPARLKVRMLLACPGWPTGVLEVGSWAAHAGLAEVCVFQIGGDGLARKLAEFRPHVVGFRLESGGLEAVRGWIAEVRRHGDATVILGGPTATSHPCEVLIACDADYVFAGEAEAPLEAFLRLAYVRDGRDRLAEVPGLAYRYGGRVFCNTLPRDGYERSILEIDPAACRPRLACLRNAQRPAADRELLAANRLNWQLLENFQTEFDSLFFTGGRGCPGACTFCAKLHGPEVRNKPAAQLLEEIEAADALVRQGRLKVSRWPLFAQCAGHPPQHEPVAWAAVYDEDFFLDRRRAVEFFALWRRSPLQDRYRLSFQTNPCSLLDGGGRPRADLFDWIGRLKPMVQLGAESFNDEVLRRWCKRHDRRQLDAALDALDATRQDYTVFQLLTDFDTTTEELIESLRVLVVAALRRPQMLVASSPYTIPLFDSDTRKLLEHRGGLAGRVRRFSDYEQVQPGWMDPLTAELADLADAELQWATRPEHREAALLRALAVVAEKLRRAARDAATPASRFDLAQLFDQAQRAFCAANDLWLAGQARGAKSLRP
jgi:hypothetical protein